MSNARTAIFGRIRAALGALPTRASRPDWDRDLVALRAADDAAAGWAGFAARLQAVNGTPLDSVAALVEFLQRQGARHGYCDPGLWPRLQPSFPTEMVVETTFDRTRVDAYQFGITRAVGAIAETGTLILSDRTTSSRLGALAPWMHVAVLAPGDIHPDLTAALAALPADPNVVWVTGPSKTADVEGILIEGVHGPGLQAALLLPPA